MPVHSALRVLGLAAAAIGSLVAPAEVFAHAGPRLTDPAPGATLGASPETIRLTFSERPEIALSTIRVLDTAGAAFHAGRPEPVPADPLSLTVRVRPLPRGVYTVTWRIVSAVDGHATSGSYAFGVGVRPSAAGGAVTVAAESSPLEVRARWIFIAGLITLAGAAAATVARFGGASDLPLAACGWLLAAAGLALLTLAQARAAGVPFSDLLAAGIGRALLGRGAAIAAAGAALLAGAVRPAMRRGAMAAAGAAAAIAIAVHAAAGHAGAGVGWTWLVAVASQWAHFSAAGVWLGGLAALLLGTRGLPSPGKSAAVRRFSTLAAAGLVVVVATGAVRTLHELASWRDLVANAYGQAVLAKVTIATAIAGLAAFNRWKSVPRAPATLAPLRRAGGAELTLAVAALGAAAWMGTLPPPASGLDAARELAVSGADFGTTVRVRLTISSDQPGPNRFVLDAADYDTGDPVDARRVSLRFTPIDDPGVAPTALTLEPQGGGTYAASGANIAFDGRWRIAALVERAGTAVEVPLDIETRAAPQHLSVLRAPGAPPEYSVEVARAGFVRLSPDAERAGRRTLTITCFDIIFEPRPVETIVVIAAAGDAPARPVSVRSSDRIRFTAEADFQPGPNTITVIARTIDGARLRAAFRFEIPE